MKKWKIFSKSDYVIATEEKDVPISDGLTTIKLLSKNSLERYAKEWKYMHIGLVQVGAKPLTKLGLDTSVLMVLRDARELEYERSVHATIETSLSMGPIHFECHPNAMIGLRDKTILDSLILQIKTHNYKMKKGALPMVVIYRIYFKLMQSAFGSKAYKIDRKGQTQLIQTDYTRANVSIPKMIHWNQVNLPEQWELDNPIPKEPIQNSEPSNIVQHPEGKVTIQFQRKSFEIPRRPLELRSISSSRKSIDSNPLIRKKSFQRIGESSSIPPPINIQPSLSGVNSTVGITRPVYDPRTDDEEIIEPTESMIGEQEDPEFNIIEKPFEINKVVLNDEFNSPKNQDLKLWYFNNFSNHAKNIKEEYFQFMKDNGFQLYFFEWFEEYYLKPKQIHVIDNCFKWQLTEGQVIESNHPPLASLRQIHKNKDIKMTPFKISNEEEGTGFKKVIEQNNFTNQHLHTIGKQLDRMENVINNEVNKSSQIQNKNTPIFKPFEMPKQPSLEFLKALNDRKKNAFC